MVKHQKNLELHNNLINKSKSVLNTRQDSSMHSYPLAQKLAKTKNKQKKMDDNKRPLKEFVTTFNENLPKQRYSPKK